MKSILSLSSLSEAQVSFIGLQSELSLGKVKPGEDTGSGFTTRKESSKPPS
mgnify:CR=1 FL=1